MYESYFGFTQSPFSLTPNTSLFHALPPHFDALQTTLAALTMGEGLIKISGEVGMGKTLVCRMLINRLPEHFDLAYLPTPPSNGVDLKLALAQELGLDTNTDMNTLTWRIHYHLIEKKIAGRSVVVVLDEAQALSDDALEAVRLLGNLETEYEKLLQIVLIGQPELDARLEQHHLRQLRQRITFSAHLRSLSFAETVAYIQHRLQSSGGDPRLFKPAQMKAIWQASAGTPRLINQLCHKALISTFSDQQPFVTKQAVQIAIKDTLGVKRSPRRFHSLLSWINT